VVVNACPVLLKLGRDLNEKESRILPKRGEQKKGREPAHNSGTHIVDLGNQLSNVPHKNERQPLLMSGGPTYIPPPPIVPIPSQAQQTYLVVALKQPHRLLVHLVENQAAHAFPEPRQARAPLRHAAAAC